MRTHPVVTVQRRVHLCDQGLKHLRFLLQDTHSIQEVHRKHRRRADMRRTAKRRCSIHLQLAPLLEALPRTTQPLPLALVARAVLVVRLARGRGRRRQARGATRVALLVSLAQLQPVAPLRLRILARALGPMRRGRVTVGRRTPAAHRVVRRVSLRRMMWLATR